MEYNAFIVEVFNLSCRILCRHHHQQHSDTDTDMLLEKKYECL